MRSNLRDVIRALAAGLVLTVVSAAVVHAQTREKIRIPVGHAEVVPSTEDVRTVAIAEPAIADAAVGSARTVLVNAKSPGSTSLVVYNEGGRYKVYDVEVYAINGDKQVQLHVQVAELSDNALRELGFDLTGSGKNNVKWLDGSLAGGLYTGKVGAPTLPIPGPSGQPDVSADGILKYARNDGRLALQAQWHALETKGDIRVLAHPTLVTRSGEKASFLAGGEVPFVTQVASAGGGIFSTTFKEFGVKLDFTPTVQEDGKIMMKVAPEVSEPDFTLGSSGGVSGGFIPGFRTRKASTSVLMDAGEYLAIGGIRQTTTSKVRRRVPFIGQIPLLGLLFTSTRNESSGRELLIVVEPELVTPGTTMPPLPTDRPDTRR
jgi:pilus assembly protein CpaC